MNKLKLEPMRPQTARGYRYLSVPKELIENQAYSSLDLGAVILYAKMLERASLSAQHIDKFTDENGRLFIIYTVEQMKKDIQRSQPTVVKWTKQLEGIGLIEKVRQGQGRPSKIFIMDFMSVVDEPDDPTSKEGKSLEVKNFNFKKSSGFTSRSKEIELQEVKDFNTIELNNKDLENNELDPTHLPADLEDGGADDSLTIEEVQAQVRDQIEFGRLYKYPYYEQVLIYAQRPEATACASFDVWNKRMNRAVRRGSRGIALLDTSDGSPKIRYVFDIADTVGRDKSRRPYLWQYQEEHTDQITAALADTFGVAADSDLPYQLEVIADDLAGEYWVEHHADILACVPGSFLEEYDEFNIEAAFRSAACASTTYALLSRCGLNPDEYFSHEDFMNVFDFNTPDAATALGTAVSENSEQVLRQIEIAIKNYERDRRAERGNEHGEQLNLQAGGGLPAAGVGYRDTIDLGEIRTDEGAVSEGAAPGAVQPPDTQWEADGAPGGDRPDSEPAIGAGDTPDSTVHGDNGADESVRPDEMGGADEQREIEGGRNDPGGADLPITTAPEVDFTAVGPTGLEFSHRENEKSAVPYFEDVSEKRELLWKAGELKDRRAEIAEFFAANTSPDERSQYVKGFFTNTYTEVILDSKQRVGYRAYDDVLHLWRGAFPAREQEEYLSWEDAASAIDGMIQDGLWVEQPKIPAPIPAPKRKPVKKEDGYAFNLFDIAGSTIPLTHEPAGEPVVIRPQVSQEVIDAALTLGANDPDSRLRIIAEFMKDKPLEDNVRFLQAHYKENGAGFYVGDRKYSLWFSEAGMQIAAGESALTFSATAVTWEQAAERIRELLDEGKYSDQSMLYHAWPYEQHRVAEALEYLHRDIDEDFKDQYLPTLSAALEGTFGYPAVVDKTMELLEQPEQLKAVIDEFTTFTKDYAHNRDILRFHFHRPQEIMQGLEDLQRTPLSFTASPDYEPVERFFISQDEIDNLLRESPDHNDYRIAVYNFFDQHPDKKEREKYLSHLHGEYSGYHGGNDNITYTHKELTFTHGSITDPYAAVRLKWTQVRRRIEELIARDNFLSEEDREIMENRTLESPAEQSTPLETVKAEIERFLQSENMASPDFSDLTNVPLVSAITQNEQHGIQISVDLEGCKFRFEVNGQEVSALQCHDLDNLAEHIRNQSARDLIDFAKKQYILKAEVGNRPVEKSHIAPRYQVAVYHHIENGFDDKLAYSTQKEAQKVAQGYVDGTYEDDGFQYEGAAIFDAQERKWLYVVGHFPVLDGVELPYLPYPLAPLERAKQLIHEYCEREFESPANLANLKEIGVAFTTITDDDIPVQVNVNLIDCCLDRYLGDALIERRQYGSLQELTDNELVNLDFADLTYVTDEEIASVMEQEEPPTVRELYEHYKAILYPKVMEDEAYRNACLYSDRQNAMDEGRNALERAAKDLGITQGDMQFYQLYFDNTAFHKRLKDELVNESYDSFMALAEELPPWGVEIGDHSPWGIVQTSKELIDGVYEVSTPSHGGIMIRQTVAKEVLAPERLAHGIPENGWYFYEEDEHAPQVYDELVQKGLIKERGSEISAPDSDVPPSEPAEKRPGQTRPERNFRNFARLFPEIADGSYRYLRMESGSGIGGMMPLHVEWVDSDTVSISHTYTQNGDLMRDPEMTFLIDRDKGTMEAATYQQDSLGLYQQVYPEPGKWIPQLRKDLNSFAQQWLKNISEQNYVKLKAIAERNGEDVTLEFDDEGMQILPEPTVDVSAIRDPLAPAYKVGDTVYLDDTAFTITDIGLHDIQLQDPTLAYPVFRAENIENFEKMLRRDERNLPITDYYVLTSIDPMDNGDDLRDVLTNEGGLLDTQAKFDIGEWLRTGLGNEEIARRLEEKYDRTAESVALETGEIVDYRVFGNSISIDLLDKYSTVRMYDLRTVAGVLRAMYQQELGGFSHTLPAPVQEPPNPEVLPEPKGPAYTTKTVAVYTAEKNNIPYDIVIETLHVDEPKLENFHITDDNLGAGGAKAKYQMNMAALKTLQQIEADNRPATPEEQETLSKYVGWGALQDAFDPNKPAWASEYKELKEILIPEEYDSARASVQNAHYTSPTVIRAIYQALEKMGFQGGNMLEPSCGVGNFFGLLPESMAKSKLYGVELDGLTGRIAQQLYPNAHIEIKGYEQTNFEKNSFDVAIGNVPFGDYRVHDPAYNKLGFSIHNYFFAKAIDQVRPGGIIAFVTSRYTMDSKSKKAREYIAKRAELLGAIRLPNNAFLANAGTGVVSDILFLQKLEQPTTDLPDWVYTDENADGYTVNRYFIQHPEMVMGTETFASTRYGYDYTVEAVPGADLSSLLGEAITHIEGNYVEAEVAELENDTQEITIPANPAVKNFSYTIIKGDVYYRQDSVMVKMELGATAKARTTALIGLRDCTQKLIRKQMALSNSDGEIKSVQAELNRLYDNFTKKFGLINDKINERAFSDDSSYYLLCALEILDDDGKFVRKADMFTKRTILPRHEITHVDTATEALAVSIGERARVDIPYMAGLTGKTEEEIISDLRGQIYPVPFHGQGGKPIYQTADEYLSGNVRQKLSVAQAAAASDPTYEINVDALTAALPRDLDASEIQVRLGATWIEPEYVDQFMRELLKTPGYAFDAVHVRYSPQVNVWNISNKGCIRKNDVAAFTTYGTARASAYELLEDALNLQNTQIFDLKEDVDGNDKRVLNVKETTLAQQKQSMIKQAFQDWIWRAPERRQKLVRKYNDEMNCIRPRQYDGSHLVLDGMNPEIQLEEHQKNAIARAVYGGNTLFAHCVGAGKTFEITASAMEMKRLGLCSKSMIVVPNHLTQQWASEFLRLYPNANILVTTKRDFEKNRRKKFCSRIATGDYDAVIIGYTQFEKVPISKQRQIHLLFQQIRDITNGIEMAKMESGERYTVKYMERTKRSLEARLRKLQADDKKDDVVCFEELGIDRLFVDEADNYKNMFLYTKMRNVAGLSTSEAQKSTDLFNKTRYLDEITDYKGTIFATGTPISNSITEMYTMQRYLQYNALKGMGIDHFDSWASRFGETTTTMELAPEGTGYRPRTRFAKFFNLPELMNIFYEVADIKTEDMLNLPTPDVEYHNEVAKPTEYQREYVQELSKRATAVRNREVDPSEDNMLKITNDGRKLGLDQRLISPLAGDDPSSKLNKCIENILAFWQNGKEDKLTQLVFCDNSTPKKDGTFNVYSDIKSKLVDHGVPEDEVAFIHDADTEAKKKELFGKVRSGKVRVLIGSTQKMGAGTNCQDRLIALHHLDCPWRPRDLTQREGRIIRRGNMNPLVHVFRYVTEATFDSYLWQTVEKKQQFIGQIMTSKSPVRSCEDVDEAALSYAEVKALCAGDPRIKERMELDVDVAKLQVMQASHRSQQYELEDKIRLFYPQEQQRLEWRIEGIQQDMDTLAAHPLPKDGFVGMDLLGQHFDERKKAGIVLLNECKNAKVFTTSKVGEYRGLEVYVKKHNLISEVRVRDGQDADQMCFSLLTEFCHYAQHRIRGNSYERNAESHFVALCGGYVLARRFGVSTEHALFQKEVFPDVPEGNPMEKCGAVKNLLSTIIRSSGMAGQEIQRGIDEIERDYGQILYTPGYKPEVRAEPLAV